MLVFLSDVHLTDGSSGTTIDPRAFNKFCRILEDVVGKDPEESKIRNLEIVLLGDIFDVIRSNLWLRPENDHPESPIRPWSTATEVDRTGWNLQRYTEEIVEKIIGQPGNIDVIRYLKEFQGYCAGLGVDVQLFYLIGNHDWLINRYASTRSKIAQFLGMPNPQFYAQNHFPYDRVFESYRVMARHGDYYDQLNYDGDRDASSMGDAIVIDLLNRFPEAVEADPVLGKMNYLVTQLREIDNVRPLLEIPAWIQGICNYMEYNYNVNVEAKVHAIWNNLVDKFFKIKFVKEHDRFGPDVIDFLEMAMRLSAGFSFSRLREILGHWLVQQLYRRADDYRKFAYNESPLKNNMVRYVVYGHTHQTEQVPLDIIVPVPGKEVIEKVYFNTGTWRKVFEHTTFDQENCEFIGWHVMTFIVFYLEEEKERDRNYEVWSASLGYGR
jgi:UDP-2,3-diacylglucosamine pyrophosphatase LpxH